MPRVFGGARDRHDRSRARRRGGASDRSAGACHADRQRAGGSRGCRASAGDAEAHLQRAGVAARAAPGRAGGRCNGPHGHRRDRQHAGRGAARGADARHASRELARDLARRPSGRRRADVFGRRAKRHARRRPAARPPEETERSLRAAIWLARLVLYIGLFGGVGGAFYAAWIAGGPLAPRTRRIVAAALECGLAASMVSVGLQGVDVLGLPLADLREPRVWMAGFATSYGWTASLAAMTLAAGRIALEYVRSGKQGARRAGAARPRHGAGRERARRRGRTADAHPSRGARARDGRRVLGRSPVAARVRDARGRTAECGVDPVLASDPGALSSRWS